MDFARGQWSNFLASIEDSASFMDNLTEQLSVTYKMLSSEKCLIGDFQAIINSQGLLFHIDLDRCFGHINEEGKLSFNPHNVYIQNLLTATGNCFEEFRLHAMATFGLVDGI